MSTQAQAHMQALVMTDFGRLELHTLPLPEPGSGEVRLSVCAAGVCGSDLHGYTGASGRRQPPLVMGHEATGRVAAVGAGVQQVNVGDSVAVMPLTRRGGVRRLMGMDAPGAYATHVVWPAERLFALPEGVSFEAGAFAEPLAVALHAASVARSRTPAIRRAFIAGAGTIGLLIAAVLRHAGVEVVMSDVSEARLAVALAVGASAALDARTQDVAAAVRDLTEGGADASFEAVGVSATVGQSLAGVKDGGTVVWVGNNQRTVEVDMQAVVTRELSVLGSYGLTDADFQEALALLGAGAIPTDILTSRRATLSEGPGLFDELLRSPETIKCLILPQA